MIAYVAHLQAKLLCDINTQQIFGCHPQPLVLKHNKQGAWSMLLCMAAVAQEGVH